MFTLRSGGQERIYLFVTTLAASCGECQSDRPGARHHVHCMLYESEEESAACDDTTKGAMKSALCVVCMCSAERGRKRDTRDANVDCSSGDAASAFAGASQHTQLASA